MIAGLASRLWGYVAAAGVAVGILLLALAQAFRAGASRAEARQDRRAVEAARTRASAEAAVHGMSDDERRRWLRGGGR